MRSSFEDIVIVLFLGVGIPFLSILFAKLADRTIKRTEETARRLANQEQKS